MKEEFDRLIYDFLSGSITKEDLHKLNEWVYSDPENQEYFEQQKRIWLLSAEYENASVHEERAYSRFAERIRKHKSRKDEKSLICEVCRLRSGNHYITVYHSFYNL